MNAVSSSPSIEPNKLKPILHLKIEQMNAEQLAMLDRILVQLEAEQLADRLSEAFDRDQAEGRLQRIAELVRQVRAEHPYA